MPGNILDVKAAVGASVKAGDVLCILEAMKMENEIVAPQDGTVASVNCRKGDVVNVGDLLVSPELNREVNDFWQKNRLRLPRSPCATRISL